MSLGAVYIPPEGSSYTPENNNYFEILCNELGAKELQDTHVVLCGDFNARTGGDNGKRYSADSVINANGRDLVDLCTSTDMCIMNGMIGLPTNTGNFTCFTANGQSVVDYLIC